MTQSDLERSFDTQCNWLGIPEPVKEVRFEPGQRWRLDRVWPEHMVAVAIEGFGHHKLSRYFGDVEKYNAATLAGYHVFRVSTRMVKDGTAVQLVERVLRKFGGLPVEEANDGRLSACSSAEC